MTVDTKAFTSGDAALTIKNMVEDATKDIAFTTMDEYTDKFDQAEVRIRGLVASVAKLHGISPNGDENDGDEDAARAFRREVEEYAEDSTAYIMARDKAANGAAPAFAGAPEPEEVAPAPQIPQPEAVVIAPAQLPEPSSVPAPTPSAPVQSFLAEPVKVTFVERPAQVLFDGVSASFATVMVRTVSSWSTAAPAIPDPDPHYKFDGMAVKVMAAALRKRKNVIATGDPGCGKTEFFTQFARRVGLPFTKVPMDGTLTRAEIIGSFRLTEGEKGSSTPFVLGMIPRLIQKPGIICLDEVDQCDPDIQYMLHSMYEGQGLTIQEDGGLYIPRHEHCYIVATANTKGRGSDNGLTHSRFEMSEATRDRYPYWLSFTYLPAAQETATIVAKSGLAEKQAKRLVKIGEQIRSGYTNGELSQPCSLRQLLDVADLYEDFEDLGADIGLALAAKTVIVNRATTNDALLISGYVKNTVSVDLNTLKI